MAVVIRMYLYGTGSKNVRVGHTEYVQARFTLLHCPRIFLSASKAGFGCWPHVFKVKLKVKVKAPLAVTLLVKTKEKESSKGTVYKMQALGKTNNKKKHNQS